jgi:hypothetical protein
MGERTASRDALDEDEPSRGRELGVSVQEDLLGWLAW